MMHADLFVLACAIFAAVVACLVGALYIIDKVWRATR